MPHTSGATFLAGHAQGFTVGDNGSDFSFLRSTQSGIERTRPMGDKGRLAPRIFGLRGLGRKLAQLAYRECGYKDFRASTWKRA